MVKTPPCELVLTDPIVELLTPLPWASQFESGPVDWRAVWRFSSFHGVRPALVQRLEQLSRSSELPQWLMTELADFKRRHTFEVLQKTSEIVTLARALDDAGIDAVFFKGAVLGQQIYGGSHFREFNDIDLMVLPRERGKAAELLEALGYNPVVADREFRRAFFDYAGQHMFRNRDTGTVVDLHWNFVGNLPFPIEAAEVLRNRTRLALGGALVPAPNIEDHGLILAGHGQKEGWASFGWALDFAKFAASFPDFNWAQAAERPEAQSASIPLLTAIHLTERMFGKVIDVDLAALAREQDRIVVDVERIRAGYYALAERKLADDLIGSLRLCETPIERLKVWWSLLTTRTIGDYEALPLPPSLWWIYRCTRPFRLIWRRLRGVQPSSSAFFEKQKGL